MPPSGTSGNDRVPRLIAHRGWPARHPENSLSGLSAAAATGCRYLEFDVQMSSDGVPLVVHDDNLQRTTGVDMSVTGSPAAMLRSVVNDPDLLPTVAEVAEWLSGSAPVEAFVELKRASLRAFGAARVVEALRPALRPAVAQCHCISFARETLRHARETLGRPIGWIVPEWNDDMRARARELAPDYVFIDYRRAPAGPLPADDWQWACYTVDDADSALELGRRGMCFVETDDIGRLWARLEARESQRR